ncbi:di-N-acetylchitobiase-like isoform X2 [Liolophura sinensis]
MHACICGWVFSLLMCVVVCSGCPCEDPSLCQPITAIPKKEVFVFSVTDLSDVWSKYDWAVVTTVVTAGYVDDQLMCLAHSKGARIVTIVNFSPTKELANSTLRDKWVAKQVTLVQKHFLDGVNFDFEDEIPRDKPDYRDGYTSLVAETRKALKALNPYTQVTVDVAWSPAHIDSRYYDYRGLALASDFLFVMSYDERSQIFGACVAAANSGYTTTLSGLMLYLDVLKVGASKLVLGVPWYGYDYPCTKLYSNNTCEIPHYPFRGVNCSDAAGRQYNYNIVIETLKNSTTGRLWDENSKSPYFNFKSTTDDQMHQMWYDDPESLTIKYKLVTTLNLRGAGMWQADALDYSNTTQAAEQRKQMWKAISTIL